MKNIDDVLAELAHLDTERINQDTIDIDQLSPLEIVRKLNAQDQTVARVVAEQVAPIACAAELFAETIRSGNRVFYVGAGTSGRLGVLDAAECPPTFGTEPGQIVGLIAGGYDTLVVAQEGVEDDEESARKDLEAHSLSSDDFVIGLTASRRTPYVISALTHAQKKGCLTALVICNSADGLEISPDVIVAVKVGPEPIAGSTRMKSGTAEKLVLNAISTTAMILLGKTFGNVMVDLKSNSQKLAARSRKILIELLGVDSNLAGRLLEDASGSVKLAIAMHWLECDAATATARLDSVGGRLIDLRTQD